jgi:RHS repeat-associated protein
MVDGVGIIHMNGRIYDPKLGRFLQADPFIQAPYDTQSLNRYSYVRNNPLNATDPSGYFWNLVVQALIAYVVSDIIVTIGINSGWSSDLIQIASFVATCWIGGCFDVSNLGQSLSQVFSTTGLQMGIIGGITSVLSGGKFGHGFVSAGISAGGAGANPAGAGIKPGEFIGRTVLGGTVSKITGGKFANGAAGAAFAMVVQIVASGETEGSGSSELTAEDAAAAKASADVYGDDSGGLLGEMGIDYDPQDGFAACLSVDESGKYTLALRGTEGPGDRGANFRQAVGLSSSQYEQAMALGIDVYQATGGDVLFTGHSLGGGLASAAAVATGGRAITFNAAGLSPFTVSGKHGGIRAHYIRGDILSIVQDFTLLPNAAGTRISHPGSGSMIDRHGIGQF